MSQFAPATPLTRAQQDHSRKSVEREDAIIPAGKRFKIRIRGGKNLDRLKMWVVIGNNNFSLLCKKIQFLGIQVSLISNIVFT